MSWFRQTRSARNLVALRQFALLTVALGYASGCDKDPASLTDAPAALDMSPAVAKLLEHKGQDKMPPEFMTRLEALAIAQGWQQKLAECKKRSHNRWDEARAELLRNGEARHVVIIFRSSTHSIPGRDMQTVILLDTHGNFLDQLACEINSRLTNMNWGRFQIVVPPKPEADGAQLVIRLDGVRGRPTNHVQFVFHGGKKLEFPLGDDDVPKDQPLKWQKNGLCRLAVKDGKFSLLFPTEKDKEQRRDPSNDSGRAAEKGKKESRGKKRGRQDNLDGCWSCATYPLPLMSATMPFTVFLLALWLEKPLQASKTLLAIFFGLGKAQALLPHLFFPVLAHATILFVELVLVFPVVLLDDGNLFSA
jgi:hypothetical protein